MGFGNSEVAVLGSSRHYSHRLSGGKGHTKRIPSRRPNSVMGCGSFIGGAFRLPRSLLCAAFPMVVTSPLQDVPETRRYACAFGRSIATRVSAPRHPGRSLPAARSLGKGRSIFYRTASSDYVRPTLARRLAHLPRPGREERRNHPRPSGAPPRGRLPFRHGRAATDAALPFLTGRSKRAVERRMNTAKVLLAKDLPPAERGDPERTVYHE